MARRALIIDCDPGQDGAIDLLLAISAPSTSTGYTVSMQTAFTRY